MENRTLRSASEIRDAFGEQVDLLVLTCETFDKGNIVAGKQLATVLRTLLYEPSKKGNKRTIPLLQQLNLHQTRFLDTSYLIDEKHLSILTGGQHGTIPACGLVDVYATSKLASFFAPLDENRPSDRYGYNDYPDWLTREVLRDRTGKTASRLDLISVVADTDGGAHVDSALPTHFSGWKKGISLGWYYENLNEEKCRLTGIELYALRQISHEVLRTFKGATPWAFRNDYGFPKFPQIPNECAQLSNGVVVAGNAKLKMMEGITLSSDA